MSAAANYLASFRQISPYDSSGVISQRATDELGAIPAANAAMSAALANTALKQAGDLDTVRMEFDQRKWETEQLRKANRRQLALGLAQAFSGGSSGSSSPQLLAVPGFNAKNTIDTALSLQDSLRANTRQATGRTAATAAEALRGMGGFVGA